jgi:hypothetical protein
MAAVAASPARAEDMPAIPVEAPVVVAAPQLQPQPQVKPYYAYRPVYAVPGTRPLYLSNYAGANYPSLRPDAAVTPTEFRALTGSQRRRRWNWFGLAR